MRSFRIDPVPVEPEPTRWQLPRPGRFPPLAAGGDLVGVGGDLRPGTLLAAYRAGLFPMSVAGLDGPVGWWCPVRRGVLPLDGLIVSRSLRRSLRRYSVTVDRAFDSVVFACADRARSGAWINDAFRAAYGELHRLGWAHSLEAWDEDGRLAGGLYGVAVGGLFAGESMFSTGTDASKVALVHLVELLRAAGAQGRLLDVQWCTAHLATLGCRELPRRRYLDQLRQAVQLPLPGCFDDGAS